MFQERERGRSCCAPSQAMRSGRESARPPPLRFWFKHCQSHWSCNGTLFLVKGCLPAGTRKEHVAGIARVCREGYPDHTSWDPNCKYFDEKSTPDNPRWMMVDIEPIQELEMVSLVDIKANPALDDMPLVQRGQRLSVQPVSKEQYDEICRMGGIS